MHADHHFLIRLTYRPRVLVYTLTALMLASQAVRETSIYGSLALAAYSLLWPHLVFHLAGARLHAREAVLRVQQLDSLHVGVYCAAMHFSPLPAVAFLTALVLSNMLLGGIRCVLAGLPFVIAGGLAWSLVCEPRFVAYPGLLTTFLSGAAVLLYAGLVAHVGFAQIQGLLSGNERIHDSNLRLRVVADRLRRYVAPQLYSSLIGQEAGARMRTVRKQLVVFFSDIEGFTALTEAMEAEALARLLNSYLAAMAEIALRFGGTIDKFIGDGIMVFFGDPYSNGPRADALACVQMAVAMRERLRTLRKEWLDEGVTAALNMRVGIHTGFCTVGNFGCDARLDYTVIGSTVNLASRLEALAGAGEILLSAETHALVGDEIRCARVGAVSIRGLARTFECYRVSQDGQSASPVLELQCKGVQIRLERALLDRERAAGLLRRALSELAVEPESKTAAPGASTL